MSTAPRFIGAARGADPMAGRTHGLPSQGDAALCAGGSMPKAIKRKHYRDAQRPSGPLVSVLHNVRCAGLALDRMAAWEPQDWLSRDYRRDHGRFTGTSATRRGKD